MPGGPESLPGCKLFSQREKSSEIPVAVVALVAMLPEALLALFLTLSRGGGGVGRLMVKFILNFHFDYWNISLGIGFCKHHIMTKCRLFLYVSKPNFICLLQDICRSPHGKPHFVRCNGTGRDKPACLTMAPDLLKQI